MMALIATAGHVDHGKSSLVNALTGVDPDRLEEEKRRGLTIDLGFAHVATSRGTVLSFIDVPGHSDFIRTMISGVSGVSIALLVVDAAEGWKPQTEEHFGILHVLGVRHGVIALTKCDKVDNNTLHERELQISQRIATSSISWSPTIRTSAKSREGLDELIQQLEHNDNDNRIVIQGRIAQH
jgi:selenocysteine-specific elongation factor